MKKLKQELDRKTDEMMSMRTDLYIGNTLKKGTEEKDNFLQHQIKALNEKLNVITESLEGMEKTHARLKKLAVPSASGTYIKNRKRRNNKIKSKVRKEKRLNLRIIAIKEKFGFEEGEDGSIRYIDTKTLNSFHRRHDAKALRVLIKNKTITGAAENKILNYLKDESSDSNSATQSSSYSSSSDDC